MADEHVGRLGGAWRRLGGRSDPAVPASPAAPGDPELSLLRQEARVQCMLARQISEVTQDGAERRDILWRQLPDASSPGPIEEKITGLDEQIEPSTGRYARPGGCARNRYRTQGTIAPPPAHGTTHHRQRQEHERWVD